MYIYIYCVLTLTYFLGNICIIIFFILHRDKLPTSIAQQFGNGYLYQYLSFSIYDYIANEFFFKNDDDDDTDVDGGTFL